MVNSCRCYHKDLYESSKGGIKDLRHFGKLLFDRQSQNCSLSDTKFGPTTSRQGQILPFEAPKAVRARANLDHFLSASLPYKLLAFHHRSSTSYPSSLRLIRSCHLSVCSSLICCVRWTRSVEVRLANLGHGEAISGHIRTRWLTSTGQQYLQSQSWPRWGQQG